MNILLCIILLLQSFISALFGTIIQPLEQPSIYNDARVIYHVIEPEVHSELEGIDPANSIDVMEKVLGEFIECNVDLSEEMRGRIQKLRKSLIAAKIQYLSCISLVKQHDEMEKAREIAYKLSQEIEKLFLDPLQPSLLFIGGHYAYSKSGSLGGHTATYEVFRQENGLLSFAVNNTVQVIHHKVDGDQICQLVYTNLQPADLDTSFWENVIRTNYMNPVQEKLMHSFYSHLDTKLLKDPNNKAMCWSYKKQKVGVCAWKSLYIWLNDNIVRGDFHEKRDSPEEQIFLNFEKFMFETLLAHFQPDESLKATVQLDNRVGPASIFLKTELERRIEELRLNSSFDAAQTQSFGA